MHPEIHIQEPFKKSWNEPQVIITHEDIKEYERLQKLKLATQMEAINTTESPLKSMANPENSDSCHSSTEMLQERLRDLHNSLLQAQLVQKQLRTPTKHSDHMQVSGLFFQSEDLKANSQIRDRIVQRHLASGSDDSSRTFDVSDRIAPKHLMSRSLPSSPTIGEIPNMTASPQVPSTSDRHFNFAPERISFIGETRQLADAVDNGFLVHASQRLCSSPKGTEIHQSTFHGPLENQRRTIDCLYYNPKIQVTESPPFRAKRKLDMGEDYSTSVKRAKSDVSQEAGIRYVSQLEMDLMTLKHKIHSVSPVKITRQSNCACSEMEKHFMEMASSAYKTVRRYDGTINSFEQFREELTQTNIVIKDSMELLQNVRRLCTH